MSVIKKRKKHLTTLTRDGDTDEWGLVIWLETKDEKKAYKEARIIVDTYNAAPDVVKPKGKKK